MNIVYNGIEILASSVEVFVLYKDVGVKRVCKNSLTSI